VSNKVELLVQIERCLINYMSPYDYDKADFVFQLLLKITTQNEIEFSKVQLCSENISNWVVSHILQYLILYLNLHNQ